ncbi:adenylyl-sulfate kinase [Mucilaginibacter sp. FT3.2]|uniref:adenylyl-sulfate kinase n=1 Tax=Mucilaginibacter sp. FT3.2 TaxID=2723090 RepID=UPI00161443DE|nr:adenylyl-sulfate kinase [Mucilaginibacter sp. FT3.2]MBB6235054.1 adenylylsulfate kinase [Mucilaginibacter sp. FT3.2]
MIILLCGLSGVGKTTLAKKVKEKLNQTEILTELIDADEYRQRLFPDLKYSKADRFENIRRLGFLANKFSAQGIVTIISAIMPYDAMRRQLVDNYDNVKVVHIDCPLSVLKLRDTKGLYKRAQLSQDDPERLGNLTGVNDPFEVPEAPHLYINTYTGDITECTGRLLTFIEYQRFLSRQQFIAC